MPGHKSELVMYLGNPASRYCNQLQSIAKDRDQSASHGHRHVSLGNRPLIHIAARVQYIFTSGLVQNCAARRILSPPCGVPKRESESHVSLKICLVRNM
jgi:hypothetical protein